MSAKWNATLLLRPLQFCGCLAPMYTFSKPSHNGVINWIRVGKEEWWLMWLKEWNTTNHHIINNKTTTIWIILSPKWNVSLLLYSPLNSCTFQSQYLNKLAITLAKWGVTQRTTIPRKVFGERTLAPRQLKHSVHLFVVLEAKTFGFLSHNGEEY